MNVSDRLKEYITYKGLKVAEYERIVGLSNGTVSSMTDNTRKSTYNRLSIASPDLNIEWLKTGKGEMIRSKPYPVNDFPPRSASDIIEEYKGKEDDYIPLLPIEAMAGTLQGFSEGVALESCRKIKSPVKGADWAIQISGDSMEPDYRNGSYLYIRKMRGSFIPWGHTLVVDTYDGVVVKNIFPVENSKEYIEARSINPKYPPFQIETSSILGFYRVLGGSFINSTI